MRTIIIERTGLKIEIENDLAGDIAGKLDYDELIDILVKKSKSSKLLCDSIFMRFAEDFGNNMADAVTRALDDFLNHKSDASPMESTVQEEFQDSFADWVYSTIADA